MKKEVIDTLIISDLHLGSNVSRPKEAVETIKNYSFKRLILLGDIFDDLNFERLNDDDFSFFSYVRSLSELDNNPEVIWIIGNHDELLLKVMPSLMKTEPHHFYKWKYKGEKYIAIHGHQFDRFLANNFFLSAMASFIYSLIQRIDFKNRTFSRFIKRMSKSWLRLSKKIAKSASIFATIRGAKYVFCGHTHQSMRKDFKRNTYFNSGCWTDIPSTYITISERGIEIKER